MKTAMKKTLLVLLAMSLLISIAACGSPTATATPTTVSAGEAAPAETTVSGETATTGSNTPSDLSGEISEIIGNEVTLRLYAVDETITEETTRTPGSGRGQTATTEPKEFSGETATIVIPVGTLIVKRVRSTMPSESTGETGESGTGPVEEEIGLDDLTVGTQLKIYYKEGTEIIEKVLAVPPRA
ncbi:MAG: hypothetical protein EOM70_01510 [Clostridia bacterium]|nr:hypothetical protein [Clostridia bacterium]